ncbi:MAG: hypothetical protein ACRDY7_15480 [Acidimicrobiia bacterium]
MSRAFFEQVVEALVGFLPPDGKVFSSRVSARNVKVWFGAEAREHYEVQLLGRGGGAAIEVGFHAEHPDAARNEEVLSRLRDGEDGWREALGTEVETGPFRGRAGGWRRASEVWEAPDLSDLGTAVDAADRLAEYITAFEPLRAAPELLT